jgi:hypothetical protein
MTLNQQGPIVSFDKSGKVYDDRLRVTGLSTKKRVTSPFQRRSEPTWLLAVLALWFLVAIALGLSGALGAVDRPPIGLAVAMSAPLLAFVLDGWLGAPLFRPVRDLPLSTLVAVQTYRIVGVVFLIAWAQGALPGAFALPAGLGDVVIGLVAPFVAAAVSRSVAGHRFWAIAWNVAGLADLVFAVFLGVTHTDSRLGIFATHPTTDALARYPFNLITTFLVPIAIILHALAFRQLAAGQRGELPTSPSIASGAKPLGA